MKKQKKKWFLWLALILILTAVPKTVVRAAEILEDPSAMITFTAHVPEGFESDVILKIKNTSTDVTHTLILAKSVEYTRSTMLLKNSPVQIEVMIADGYITDLEETYIFADVETVDFNVLEDTGEQQEVSESENSGETTDSSIPHGEDTDVEIDELTGLESADSVWERFVSTCSVMDGDPNYEKYISMSSAQLIKQAYLEDKETNTEEIWDAMTPLDRYILRKAYTEPKLYLSKNPEDEKDFLENIDDDLMLNNIEGGDVILDALEDLWRWHYKYYLHTGTFYDFYADHEGEYKGTTLDGSGSAAASKSDMDEIEEIKQELSDSEKEEIKEALEEEFPQREEEKDEGGSGSIIVIVSILAVVCIAAIVAVVLAKRKKS